MKPLFGGFLVGVYTTALRRFVFGDGDAPRYWRMPMWDGFPACGDCAWL